MPIKTQGTIRDTSSISNDPGLSAKKKRSGESFKVDVPFAMYNDKIADDQMSMKITSVVRINKTQKSFCDTLDFQMTNPSCVEIEVSSLRVPRTDS